MNKPPESFVSVQEDRLLAFATACFEKAGLVPEHAALISRLLVNSDLRGVRSHGTRTVNHYCQAFEDGRLNPKPDIRKIHETPTSVVYDGDGSLGYWSMVKATEDAIARAKAVGIGMGLVRGIGHYGSAGHYTRMCMEAGCIGFSVQGHRNAGRHGFDGGGPNPGKHLGYFGNPPISFAIPAQDEPDLVLDAATCILADYQRGDEYEALFSMIPAAFFKSVGYGAVAAMLGGGLTGFTLSDDTWNRWANGRQGGMVLAIHIDSVVPEAVFRAETDRLAHDIRTTYTPMPGTDRSLLPGAIEEERLTLHRAQGIRYGEMEQTAARAASARLGVPVPWDEE